MSSSRTNPVAPTTLYPLPIRPHSHARNFENAGNTCYLSTVLVALFAEFDACDALLTPTSPTVSAARLSLCAALRAAVNRLRSADVVRKPLVADVRTQLVTLRWQGGTAQQDAAELFAFLFDALGAPFVPLYNNLWHAGVPDAADHAPSTERLLWLDLVGAGGRGRIALKSMLDDYFFGQKRQGLRRRGVGVDAAVTKSLIPFYTPTRETGETVSARRDKFRYLTVPLAVNRFQMGTGRKSRDAVAVPTAVDATEYVNAFAGGAQYTLILRSVVCHTGAEIRKGHYVAYTYGPRVGWRRWNDLDARPVRSVRGSVVSGEPEDERWAEEIARDCYLLFYELVPGDGEDDMNGRRAERWRREMQIMADAQIAAQSQVEEDHCGAFREQVLSGGGLSIDGVPLQPLDFWPKK